MSESDEEFLRRIFHGDRYLALFENEKVRLEALARRGLDAKKAKNDVLEEAAKVARAKYASIRSLMGDSDEDTFAVQQYAANTAYEIEAAIRQLKDTP